MIQCWELLSPQSRYWKFCSAALSCTRTDCIVITNNRPVFLYALLSPLRNRISPRCAGYQAAHRRRAKPAGNIPALPLPRGQGRVSGRAGSVGPHLQNLHCWRVGTYLLPTPCAGRRTQLRASLTGLCVRPARSCLVDGTLAKEQPKSDGNAQGRVLASFGGFGGFLSDGSQADAAGFPVWRENRLGVVVGCRPP